MSALLIAHFLLLFGAHNHVCECEAVVPASLKTAAETLIITEVMQNPNAVSDANGEWFEVYNPGSTTVNMNGWIIRDNGSDSHTITTNVNIPAGSYAVLAKNSNAATNGGVSAVYQYAGITLSNGADEIVLVCPDGTVSDTVEYDGGTSWPDPTGASMVLSSLTANNNVGSNWTTSTDTFGSGDKGTPGSGPGGSTGGNQAPVVNAGADKSFNWNGSNITTTLAGTATDADGDNLTTAWSLLSGTAANVSMTSPASLSTSVTFTATGFYTFQLSANDGSETATDTVMVQVRTTPSSTGAFNVYFGNLHAHSSYSDGNKSNDPNTAGVAVAHRYARDNAGLDWYMIADHNHGSAGMAIADYHSGVQETNVVNNESSDFVAIYGMEWGTISTGGHVIMDSDTLWGWEAGNYDVFVEKGDYTSLFQQIVSNNSLGHLCHPDTDHFDNIFNIPYSLAFDNAVSSIAIKSGPAFAEETDMSNPSSGSDLSRYNDLLLKGYHLGPGADQDTHYANWGLANQQMTAVLATELTRPAILEALRAGRVYAVEDRNIVVDFIADFGGQDHAMSSILQVPAGQSVAFSVNISDPDGEATSAITLYRGVVGGAVTTAATASGASLSYTFTPSNEGENNFFYLIATQADGQKATTAPIWVEVGTGQTPQNQAPNASFSASTSDLVATFTDNSSDSDGSIAGRAWNFGDGATSTAANPGHTYAAAGSYTVTLTVTDNDGATDSASQTVTVTAPPTGGNEISNGQTITGLSASTGTDVVFKILVPAGASDLNITISGGSGDADLYTRFGAEPTDSNYDCRPYKSGNNESCTVASPNAGETWIRIKAYSGFANLSLTASYTEPGSGGGSGGSGGGDTQTNLSASSGTWLNYTLDVPAGMSQLNIAISGGSGDADLYVRYGAEPTTSSYDYRPYLNGNNETVTVSNPAAGTWHIGIRAYSTFSGLTLEAAYTP